MAYWLSEAEVLECMTPDLVLGAVEKAFRDLARHRAINLPRERLRLPTGVAQHILQGSLLEEGVMGYKAYTSSRYGNRFAVFLFDTETGALQGALEANVLGQWRTGAASAIATQAMAAGQSPKIIGVIGAGWQAEGQVKLLSHMYPLAEFRVFSRRIEECMLWCLRLHKELSIPIHAVSRVDDATQEADVLVTATTSTHPVFDAAYLKPGVHINAVGANALNRCEIPERVMREAWCVVDQRETAQRECGDLLALVEKGHRRWQALPELGEVLENIRAERKFVGQVSVFESQGLGVLDVAVAHAIGQVAVSRGFGTHAPLHFLEG